MPNLLVRSWSALIISAIGPSVGGLPIFSTIRCGTLRRKFKDMSADNARTQDGYPDFPRREHRPQSFGQSHHSIFGHIILRTSSSDQPEDGRRGNNLPSFAVRL